MSISGVDRLTSFSTTHTFPDRSHVYITPLGSNVTPAISGQKPKMSVSIKPAGKLAPRSRAGESATIPSQTAAQSRSRRLNTGG